MRQYIGMDSLVATLFVMKYDKGETRISLDLLEQYEIEVERILLAEKVDAVILNYRYKLNSMLIDYADCFEISNSDIVMKKNVNINFVKNKWINHFELDVIIALSKAYKNLKVEK